MKEKTLKDHKIKDKKISLKASSCHYFAAICFLLIGLMFAFLEKKPPIGLLYMSLGSLAFGQGAQAAAKEKKQNGESEEEKKPQ